MRCIKQETSNYSRSLQQKSAFSLIELSIVIGIIGLLLVGVTQGSSIFSLSEMMLVRSHSANAPFLNKDSLTLWLDTAQENTFSYLVGSSYVPIATANNNTKIQRWNDVKIGQQSKIHISQSTLENGATYLRKGINNLPALSFNGSNSYSAPNISPLQLFSDSKASIFIVQNYKSINASNLFSWNLGTAQNVVISNSNNGSVIFKFATDTATTSAAVIAVEKPTILSFVKNLNSITIRANGSSLLSGFNYIGRLNSNSPAAAEVGRSFNGAISEIIIFKESLKDSDVLEVERYLSEKWRIPIVKNN